jgi:uncharacterized protein (DUF1800 family)
MALTDAAVALNRFGLGARPTDTPPTDPKAWLADQLGRFEPRPAVLSAQPRSASAAADYIARQREVAQARQSSEQDRMAARRMLVADARDDYQDAVNARAAVALSTDTPFVERLVHFWSNHFAISTEKPQVAALAGAFEADAIRPHVLGRFEDMLVAVERHPAMQIYLDQIQSVGPGSVQATRVAQRPAGRKLGLNENLAREIMELHTLGVRSGYSQADVTEFARALTGWSIGGLGPGGGQLANAEPGDFLFRPLLHEPGARTIMGRRYNQPGEGQARAVLADLAASPATGRHLAMKLARHFVADDPPPVLVDRLAAAYDRSRGDLPTLYRTLIASPEAWAPQPAKFKTPWEWTISSLRGLGRIDLGRMQIAAMQNQLGQPVWRPGSPAGFDDIAASWAAPDALIRRVELAQRLAAQAGDRIDARQLSERLLPGVQSQDAKDQIARAESPTAALALLLVSPDFQRR